MTRACLVSPWKCHGLHWLLARARRAASVAGAVALAVALLAVVIACRDDEDDEGWA